MSKDKKISKKKKPKTKKNKEKINYNKILIIFIIICIIIVNIFIFSILKIDKKLVRYLEKNITYTVNREKKYFEVYQNDLLISSFEKYEQALEYAKKYENSSIKKYGEYNWLWDSNPPFEVYQGYKVLKKFLNFKEALEYAKKYENSSVFFRKASKFIWDSHNLNKKSYQIEGVPHIGQYPELYRGCEVTSLAMLLNYYKINVTKMELAKKIKKEPFIFKLNDGKTYNGNPHSGFVGDIYSIKNKGYGVYNEPLHELLSSYVGNSAINLTGINFEDLYYYINKNIPIVVIINTKFKPLAENEFEKLKTTKGDIKITYKEHSVVITGYDENYIYFNDPMYPNIKGKKNKNEFIKAWEQMGKQAIIYSP